MWEYRWVEVEAGDSDALLELGREDWEAVSGTPVQNAFGRTWLGILMKRPAGPRAVDVAGYEARVTAPAPRAEAF